jgi:protein SCO1/2
MDRRLLLPSLVIAVGLVLVAASAWLTFSGPGAPPPSTIGGAFQLTDQDGKTVTQDTFKGAPTVIFFGYTHCPDVCPTTLFEVTQIFKALGDKAKINGIFVSVDPERDTPELLKDYLSNFDPRIHGLTGTKEQLEPMFKAYRVYARKVPGSDGYYSMDHSAIVYLMDKQMRFIGPLNISDEDAALKDIRKWM